MSQPFRWNLAKREQLGDVAPQEVSPATLEELRRCCARIIAFCDNADLVFVGRSPEAIFDYLSGMLAATSWADRLCLLNISLSSSGPRRKEEWWEDPQNDREWYSIEPLRKRHPEAIKAIHEQLRAVALDSRLGCVVPSHAALLADCAWSPRHQQYQLAYNRISLERRNCRATAPVILSWK